MKSMFFACALLLGSAEAFSAENLVLSEDFESQTFPPSGWVVKGTELSEDLESGYAHWSLNWNEVTGCSIAGSGCAEVTSDFKEGQAGISKEEWLITPAVQVADNASLSFTFWCNASSFMTNKYGSFLVKVSTDDGDTWSDLWNAASQEDIENSGLTWPWNKDAMGIENNWQKLTPNVSLNAVGKNENASVWSFTTMEDQSVRDFPYTMGFEGNNGEIPPMGWKNDHEGKGIQMWKSNEIEPFAGKYSASVWHNNAGEVSILTSPVFAIPETGDIVASFAWGGALCNRLEKGYENEAITEGPISEVNDADGTLYFEIRAVDAADWTPLAYTQDRTKWRHKYVSLADYAGKSVNMRWRFVATENAGVSSGGASLDEIFVGDIKDMPTLAVSEIKKENLAVYPNPTSDYVYWAGGKADVKVYDLAGNCIKDLTGVESVSLEGLASGMYIVSVSCGDSVSTARVMKR